MKSVEDDFPMYWQMHLAVNFLVQLNFAFHTPASPLPGEKVQLRKNIQLLFLNSTPLPPKLVLVKNIASGGKHCH